MKLSVKTIILLSAAVLVLGLGCSNTVVNEKKGPQTQLDAGIKLFVEKPDGWDITKFNTLYKNPKTPSGYTYVAGGVNYGLGPKDAKGDTHVKLHVIGVPKAYVDLFEKGKFPLNAERRLETAEYIIYTAVIDEKDSDVAAVMKSLIVKP